jgi:protein involved in polysaccharide export with SLBB domain
MRLLVLGHFFWHTIIAARTKERAKVKDLRILMKPKSNSGNNIARQQAGLRLFLVMLLLAVSAQLWAQDDPAGVADVSYRLGAGDKLQIDVFNQADLTGEYTLDGNGRFSMHLIGKVEAANLTPTELEALLVSKLKPDYLVNPRVSVRVQNFRPFYIMGEVRGPGSYAYVDGMTYLTAVVIAGGYTYRARKDHVYVVHDDDPGREEFKLDVNDKVQPGDIIRVAERIF